MNSPYMGKFKVSQEYKGSTHDGLDLVGIDSKEIHSTVNGVVERAGWENSANHSQGFGQYVRIKKDGTNERYYFGHLSKINVKVGDKVKITQVIGIEGNTGYSFGSHCHYCCRNNASKSEIKNICTISGIPNKIGTYDDGYRTNTSNTTINKTETKKTNTVSNTIKVGSTVKVKSGAKDLNNGKKIALWAIARKYTVKSLNGKKAVLTYNGAVFAAISTDDLVLA